MNKVRVVSSAHTSDANAWACLRESCNRLQIPLTVLGTHTPLSYASNDPRLFIETVQEVIDYLKVIPERYVVLTDAFDVFAVRWNESELIDTICNTNGQLLLSCEANCFPHAGPWQVAYDKESNIPWRYINGGQMCGAAVSVITLLETLKARIGEVVFGGGTQEILHKLYFELYPMGLDRRCSIFQSMYTEAVKWIATSVDKLVVNKLTHSKPMFLHFNGRAPGMPEWYDWWSKGLEYEQ